nr:unnamed protein product [Digitaria exilis]
MNDFHIGWFMHPMVYGDYPPVMRKNVGSRLPSFSDEDRKRVTGSFDFVGFNHYIAVYYLFGYRLRFGVYGVDFNSTARTRYQRHSAKWYSSFLRGGELRPVALPEGAYSE